MSIGTDVLPIKSTSWNLVKFVFREEDGREEAIYRRTDYWVSETGRWGPTGQGIVSAAWQPAGLADSMVSKNYIFPILYHES